MLKRIRDQLLIAIAGAIVALILGAALWVWGGLYDRLRTEISDWVISQISFSVKKSDPTYPAVQNFACDTGEQLVSASCIGIDSGGYKQVAVGPDFNPDRSFSCYSYGAIQMKVQATAICYKVQGR